MSAVSETGISATNEMGINSACETVISAANKTSGRSGKKVSSAYQITSLCHRFVEAHIQPGDLCIDATAGNGNDTAFLCELVGPEGKVLAFDIQECALTATDARLTANDLRDRCTLYHESHELIDTHVSPGTVSCMMFNFGYLPGGDHALATQAESSVTAVMRGLPLLKVGGIMSLCIYSGGDTGFAERDALLACLKTLDSRQYMVILTQYYNRPNNPPIPAFIVRLK